MRKITFLFSLAIMVLTLPSIAVSADLTPGNLVVLRIGEGSVTLTSTSNPSFLEEYTTMGSLIQTVANPIAGDHMITNSGSATSEGALSSNRYNINFAGYNAAPGTASINGTTSATVNRIIISYAKNLSITSIKSSTAYSGNNIRSAVRNGSDFWAAGTGSTVGTNGIQYFGTGSPVQVSATITNTRVVNIFNDQLYFSTGSAPIGIYKVGSGLPTLTGETSVAIINTTSSGTGTASPYGFAFNSTTTVCYIADDRTTANGGGVQKWTESAGTWSLAYILNLSVGARGLAVNWSSNNPEIYAVGTDNKIYKVEDTGSNATATVLATAATNTVYRGIAFTPDLFTSIEKIETPAWSLSNNTLSFTELPSSKIEIYTLTGSKAAIFEPAQIIKLNLSKGIYILKADNKSSKIVLN